MKDIPFFAEHGQLTFRWIHLVAGVLWIGILYFFNWVNGAFAATLDAESKKKVVPELMPRALYWFRWGAAWTWITGVILMFLLYYMSGANFFAPGTENSGVKPTAMQWGMPFAILIIGFIVYDQIFKNLPHTAGVIVWGVIAIGFAFLMNHTWEMSARAVYIHVAALFGTAMAANVWMRIWPAQQRIITAIKNGQAPEAADPAMAGLRSKHNTYMSVPLLLFMVGTGQTAFTGVDNSEVWVAVTLAIGWISTFLIYKKVPGVKGF